MANSLMQLVSDGNLSVVPLTIKFFEQSHIGVYIDDVALPTGRYSYTWSGATTITITPTVALGVEVSIRRRTPADYVLHDFQAGAVFSETSIDENFRQDLFLLQEASEQSFITDLYDNLNMHANKLVNLGEATSPNDAVSLGQVEAIVAGNDPSGKTNRRKIVILATGQSNVQQEPAFVWNPPSNVFLWAWPGLGATGNKFIPCPKDKINHCYASAAELARLNPLWDVYIVKIASGGRPIDHWLPGGSSTTLPEWNAYEDCKNNTEVALASLGLTKIDYFHWHQGESDINSLGSYTAKWKLVFGRFCGEAWFKRNTRVLINGVTSTAIKGDPNYAQINMKLRSIARDSPSLRTFVPTAEIVPIDLWLADGLHMSGEGHLFLGTAEAQALQFGGALPVPQGYAYDPETGNICLGGAAPAAGGTVEVNKGSLPSGLSYNARTSLDVINTQTDTGDLVSLRAIGANGTYSVTGYAQGALANTVRMEWSGTSQMQHAITSNGAYKYYCGPTEVLSVQNTLIRAGTDATVFAGNASFRFKTIYLETAPVVTSDERMKSPPKPIDDTVLDAWADVGFWQYRMLSGIEQEGDGAPIHFGVIAQRVIEAFAAHDLNALHYGLIRHDRWDGSPAEYQVLPAEYNEDGELVCEERTILVSPEVAAGDRYSIIYDEALIVEVELQRRNYQRLMARVAALESKIAT